jgi:hypothetical protein
VLTASITSSVTDALTSFIGDQAVYAVFVLMFIDAMLPAASELVMVYGGAVAAGAFAGQDVVVFGKRSTSGQATHRRRRDRVHTLGSLRVGDRRLRRQASSTARTLAPHPRRLAAPSVVRPLEAGPSWADHAGRARSSRFPRASSTWGRTRPTSSARRLGRSSPASAGRSASWGVHHSFATSRSQSSLS